ncbi:hypothetical protein GCM10022244_29750 [Streptomyces gulbargensis]|uniref:Cyclic-phosphate processing Receiver domain-containing protein n=1 Tax=Streptomyces gulbargensis TaxID=364901 RepID=A0ABP7MB50_9ACTN
MKEALTSPAPVILGIDDLRPLPRATRVARTSHEGVQLLEEHRNSFIDELWLDHDLGGEDTIMPVVTLMEEAAFRQPFQIGAVFVHSANPIGAETIVRSLGAGATESSGQWRREPGPMASATGGLGHDEGRGQARGTRSRYAPAATSTRTTTTPAHRTADGAERRGEGR